MSKFRAKETYSGISWTHVLGIHFLSQWLSLLKPLSERKDLLIIFKAWVGGYKMLTINKHRFLKCLIRKERFNYFLAFIWLTSAKLCPSCPGMALVPITLRACLLQHSLCHSLLATNEKKSFNLLGLHLNMHAKQLKLVKLRGGTRPDFFLLYVAALEFSHFCKH